MAEINLNQVYLDLKRFTESSDYEKAIKSANKILHHYPDDERAFKCRIIALIHLLRFDDALLAFNKNPKLAANLTFEKAYCQYRGNQLADALSTIDSVKNPSLSFIELKAQIFYRLEKYEECLELYRDVIKNSTDDYDEERQVNLAAVLSNISSIRKDTVMPSFTSECYELTYNSACGLIAKGQYSEADKLLAQASKQCRASFDEDTSLEEIEDELLVIQLQHAFCLHKLGRDKEAQGIYNQVLKRKPDDLSLLAIASNNSVALNRYKSLFDSKKKIKNALTEAAQQKLTSQQKQIVAINNCLLNIYTTQGEGAVSLCNKLTEKYPQAKEPITLAKAVILYRDKQEEALELLRNYGVKNPGSKLLVDLAAVQLLLSKGQLEQAAAILEGLGEASFQPGVVSALVTLYTELGQGAKCAELLERAVEWHQRNKSSADLGDLWRQSARMHLGSGRPEVAARSLEQLLRLSPRDTLTIAQLMLAYAKFDPSRAKQLSDQLPQLIDLSPNIDVDFLESSNWMKGAKVLTKKAGISPNIKKANKEEDKKKKKKKRKKRLPKNYEPGTEPDPERWLPKRERSTWRKKKDRRGKDVGKGTQGAATGASDQFDITKMSKGSSGQGVAVSPQAEGPRQQQRKHQAHKKKKKGSKW